MSIRLHRKRNVATEPRSRRPRLVLTAIAGMAIGSLLGPPVAGAASETFKDVIIRNTTSEPVPTAAQGTTEVAGTVDVGNLPATQQVKVETKKYLLNEEAYLNASRSVEIYSADTSKVNKAKAYLEALCMADPCPSTVRVGITGNLGWTGSYGLNYGLEVINLGVDNGFGSQLAVTRLYDLPGELLTFNLSCSCTGAGNVRVRLAVLGSSV